jgi:hypothetical protein
MVAVTGQSADAGVPGVAGENDAGGDGVVGRGRRGVVGESDTFQGVYGKSGDNAGVVGESDRLHGVFGVCHNPNGAGTFGTNDQGGQGVQGSSKTGIGVWGNSETGDGVVGQGRRGVVGESATFQGVYGKSGDNAGVVGESDRLHGVFGVCHNPNGGGLFGTNDAGGFAAVLDGRVAISGNCEVKGDVLLTGGDLAEHFGVAETADVEPGTVMVLEGNDRVRVSDAAYDPKVAGVISGAGEYRPGVVLDHHGHTASRQPLALVGKVFCKVDASTGPIEVGDLLTTSARPGHAMKAADQQRSFGAILGKAMGSCASGTGMVAVLVGLG